MSLIKGDNQVIQTDRQMHWDRDGGVYWTEHFSGPKVAAEAHAASLINIASEVQSGKIGNGPRFGVVAKYGRDPSAGQSSDFVNDDELESNEISQSVFESPTLRALIPASVAASILSSVELVKNGTKTYSAATGDITAACLAASLSNANALQVFDDVLQERTNYYNTAYVYRRVVTVDRQSTIVAALTNINYVHTTAEMRFAERTPAGFPLPDGYWLKMAPKVRASLRQKTQIQYEYWWGTGYNPLYYAFLTPP